MTNQASGITAPIFIVGHPRSGTSLLAAMLGRHPAILALPETHYFNEVRYAIAPHLAMGPAAVAARLARTRMRHLPLEEAAVAAALADAEMSRRGVFEALAGAMLARAGRERLVEKTPVHIRHIDEILASWPDAQVIWILRDGRAAVSSLRKQDWASDDLSVLARQWTRNMRFAVAAHAANPARVTRIDYEDLIESPADTLFRICGRVGLRYDPAMLDHTTPTETVSAFERAWKGNVDAPVNAGRAAAWRRELEPAEIAEIEAIMAPVLVELGYPVSRSSSFRAVVEGLRERLSNNALGRRAQMLAYEVIATHRFAPDAANQGNLRRR